jgi:hypothetical protein
MKWKGQRPGRAHQSPGSDRAGECSAWPRRTHRLHLCSCDFPRLHWMVVLGHHLPSEVPVFQLPARIRIAVLDQENLLPVLLRTADKYANHFRSCARHADFCFCCSWDSRLCGRGRVESHGSIWGGQPGWQMSEARATCGEIRTYVNKHRDGAVPCSRR